MAGIGFELRKITDGSHGLVHALKSYGLAAVIINGPMVLCMFTISIAHCLLGSGTYSGIPADGILATVSYAFIISSIITGSYSLTLIRYVSDSIYNKEYSNVFPSLMGAIIPSLFLSIAASLSMVLWGGLNIDYGISVSALFSIVSIVWLEMIYLSAVRNYKTIIKGFASGSITGVSLLFLTGSVIGEWKLHYVFFCFTAAFTVTAILLMHQIRRLFGEGTGSAMKWTGYFRKYPSLFMTGLFYTVGLYFLCIYYRFNCNHIFTGGFITARPEFDLPFFWSVLGIVPGLVYFTVKFETSLYTHCRELYLKINNNGTCSEIDYCIKNVIITVKYCFIKLALIQAAVMMLMLSAPLAVMQIDRSVQVFRAFTIGLSSTLVIYVAMLVVLYFDGRGYALTVSSIYMGTNVMFTLFFNNSACGPTGFGFMIASVISMTISIILLIVFMAKLRDFIFVMK